MQLRLQVLQFDSRLEVVSVLTPLFPDSFTLSYLQKAKNKTFTKWMQSTMTGKHLFYDEYILNFWTKINFDVFLEVKQILYNCPDDSTMMMWKIKRKTLFNNWELYFLEKKQ